MSKYSDNPYWCHIHDQPVMLMSWEEWNSAREAGFLTEEHVVGRLTNIANYALGNGAELGFDADGFLVSLVADGMKLEGGVTLQVYSNDHPPPHVHVLLRSHPSVKLRIRLDTGELMDRPKAVRSKDLRRFKGLVLEHSDTLASRWEKRAAAEVRP